MQEFDAIKLLNNIQINFTVQGIINPQIDRTLQWKGFMRFIHEYDFPAIELLLPETIKRVKQTQPNEQNQDNK